MHTNISCSEPGTNVYGTEQVQVNTGKYLYLFIYTHNGGGTFQNYMELILPGC